MSRALSLAGFQVTLIGRIWVTPEAQIEVTTAEAILFAVLLAFSFVAGNSFWQTVINLLYIYCFPFVLLFYAFYWPIRVLRISLPKIGATRSETVPTGSLVLQASPKSMVLTAPISERKDVTESKLRSALEVLTRPFRKFTYLWCLLVLLATHKPVVRLALVVLLLQLAWKIWWVMRLLWSSKTLLVRAANSASTTLNMMVDKLTSLNFEVAPLTELKNLWTQIRSLRPFLEYVTKSTFFSRLTFGIGLALLVCAHTYFALIFSCVYVGAAKLAGVAFPWLESLTDSLFILAYVTELPKTSMLRVLGGLHYLLFLTLGAGTIVSYFRKQLEPLHSALASVNVRLAQEGVQERIIILQTKIDAAASEVKTEKS